jgi:hypothetical protein
MWSSDIVSHGQQCDVTDSQLRLDLQETDTVETAFHMWFTAIQNYILCVETTSMVFKNLSLIPLITINVRKVKTSWRFAVSMVVWYSQMYLCSLVYTSVNPLIQDIGDRKRSLLSPIRASNFELFILSSSNGPRTLYSRFRLCPVVNLLALTVKSPRWLKPLSKPLGDVTSVIRLGIRKQYSLCHWCSCSVVCWDCEVTRKVLGACVREMTVCWKFRVRHAKMHFYLYGSHPIVFISK